MRKGGIVLLLATVATATATYYDVFSNSIVNFIQSSKACGYRATPTLIGRLPEGRPVYGVRPDGDEIYVIRDSTPYIEVYDRKTFQAKRNITVEGLRGPYDMVQSKQNADAMFIADWFDSNNLTVVPLSGGGVSRWSFLEEKLTTIALYGENSRTRRNIIVTATVSQKLKEFTPGGQLVREIKLRDISKPRQGIPLRGENFAVCQGYGPPPELHRVCIVKATGETMKCLGATEGSGPGQFKVPARLEMNKKQCILVADSGNKRIVLLDKNLKYVGDLINKDLDGPYRLYLDERRNHLFIADNSVNASGIAVKGRVLVYQLK